MLAMADSEHRLKLIENQARRKDLTPREYCILQINKWRRRLEYFSEDYRELSDLEMQKAIDEEIKQRKERDNEWTLKSLSRISENESINIGWKCPML